MRARILCAFAVLLLAAGQRAGAQTGTPMILPDVGGFNVFTGQSLSVQFSVQNPPSGGVNQGWAITAGSLPSGFSLSTSGLLTGSSTTPQTATFQVTTVYSFPVYTVYIPPLTVNRTYTINVDRELVLVTPSPLPPVTSGAAFTRSIAANQPAYWDSGGGNLPSGVNLIPPVGSSLTLPLAGVFPPVASPTQYTFTVYASTIGYIPQTIQRTYAITVNPPLVLSATFPPATAGESFSSALAALGGTTPYTYSIAAGALPPGLTLSATTGALTGTPSMPGTYVFTGRVTDASGADATGVFTIVVAPPPLSVLTGPLPPATAGLSYLTSIGAAGGAPPYTFSLESGVLPAGVSLSSGGLLQGTPLQAGTFSFVVRVTDTAQAFATGAFSLQVLAPPLSLVTQAVPAGSVGLPYSAQFTASGGVTPYSWSILAGNLPPGLALDASSGMLSGTPSATGSYTFTVQVRDQSQSVASREFTVRISDPLLITTATLPVTTEGLAYQAAIAAAGGFPPYVFSLAGGGLPPGIALATDGTLSGSATAAGQFTLTVRVVDSEGQAAERAYTLTVFQRPAIITATLPDGRVGESYSAPVEAAGHSPFQWSVTSGSLPQGLALNAQTGAITGTPTQHGAFTFEVTVIDGNQPPLSASRTFTLNVALPPLPPLTITQLEESVAPASQPAFGLQLSQAFPVELNGTATLTFTPEEGLPQDPAVRFANGGTTVNFTIPAGQAAALPATGSQFAFQTGTTAGTVTLSAVLRLGSTVLDPAPFVVKTVRIPASGPVITNLTIIRNPAGFEIRVTGYSNIRQISGAVFRFTAAPGAALGTAEVSVPVASVFQQWFSSETSRQFGGQFLLVVPFTLDGSAGGLASVQVTLTNSAGSGSAAANF